MLHSAIAGPTLANKLLSLCLSHYQLASTTVTGIPMKEEQNASRWANTSASKSSIRRFVITEKAPTRVADQISRLETVGSMPV